MWGQRFRAAAELPARRGSFRSELVVPAILSPVLVPNRVFNGVPMVLRATKMNEDAGAGHDETGSTGDLLSPVLFSHPNSVFDGALSYCWWLRRLQ